MVIQSLVLEVSYNRPKLSPCARWNPDALTFANSSTMIAISTGLFVDTSNTVYATAFNLTSVLVWPVGSPNATRSIFSGLTLSHSIFVTIDGDAYVDNGNTYHQLEKWAANASNSTIAMYVNGPCGGVFVDIYGSIYCSLTLSHLVLKRSFDRDANTSAIVAGNGTAGPAPDLLHQAYGIFVNIDLSLYVADCYNDRIQVFRPNQLNATTVAGTGAPDTIILNQPGGIVLDMDGYLFITDRSNHRIVGSGPNGFRCIAACTGSNGLAADQLYQPFALSFDTFGNLYVTDANHHRIQKFILARNTCGKPLQS